MSIEQEYTTSNTAGIIKKIPQQASIAEQSRKKKYESSIQEKQKVVENIKPKGK